MTTVRAATPTDAPAIRFVARESWHAAYDDILDPETVDETVDAWYDLEDLRGSIAAHEEAVYVATVDAEASDTATEPADNPAGDVVGFAHVAPGEEPSVARLVRIYVRPPFWGRGIGR